MRVELINTGSELLHGSVLNTHQQWLGQRLAAAGYELNHQQTVPDAGAAIQSAVREAIGRSELIIVTGGLGPTSDDITRQRISELLDTPLEEHAKTRESIAAFFNERNRPMPETVLIQAQVPVGAIVLPNHHGTAPGLAIRTPKGWLIMLPGPPRELRPMYTDTVVPLLAEKLPPENPINMRTIKTMGIGESAVEERIASPMAELLDAGLEIGYCARMGEVDIRLMARESGASELIDCAEAIAQKHMGDFIYGRDDDRLEEVIVRELTERGLTLAVAESCTGGFLAHRITNVSGASAVFLVGHCTYSNEAKREMLGVKTETLAAQGAVSGEVACEMAEGARARHGADFALSTTGIAGPTGGTEGKPIGTVFIALAGSRGTEVINPCNPSDRETFKHITTQQALDLLRRNV
ncbi:MAG: competence/damage-inducible protein A [Verrucomicrobiota bacterium]|nr:competence/damage-inducible protein A [Verrucomicrobiota bacterium]